MMKNSHEKLKAICDEINYGYIHKYTYIDHVWFMKAEKFLDKWEEAIDVREIIFTPNFINIYCDFVMKDFHRETAKEIVMMWLWDDLDNPVDFLYNLMIKEWNK